MNQSMLISIAIMTIAVMSGEVSYTEANILTVQEGNILGLSWSTTTESNSDNIENGQVTEHTQNYNKLLTPEDSSKDSPGETTPTMDAGMISNLESQETTTNPSDLEPSPQEKHHGLPIGMYVHLAIAVTLMALALGGAGYKRYKGKETTQQSDEKEESSVDPSCCTTYDSQVDVESGGSDFAKPPIKPPRCKVVQITPCHRLITVVDFTDSAWIATFCGKGQREILRKIPIFANNGWGSKHPSIVKLLTSPVDKPATNSATRQSSLRRWSFGNAEAAYKSGEAPNNYRHSELPPDHSDAFGDFGNFTA